MLVSEHVQFMFDKQLTLMSESASCESLQRLCAWQTTPASIVCWFSPKFLVCTVINILVYYKNCTLSLQASKPRVFSNPIILSVRALSLFPFTHPASACSLDLPYPLLTQIYQWNKLSEYKILEVYQTDDKKVIYGNSSNKTIRFTKSQIENVAKTYFVRSQITRNKKIKGHTFNSQLFKTKSCWTALQKCLFTSIRWKKTRK